MPRRKKIFSQARRLFIMLLTSRLFMVQNKKKNLIFFVFLFLPVVLSAQVINNFKQTENLQYWEISAFWGPSLFMGDIKYYRYVPAKEEWRFAYGLSAGRRFSALFGARGNLLSGQLAGKQKAGNYRMQSHYNEMSLSGLLYLDNLFGKKRTDRRIQPYLLAGVGLVFYNTELFTLKPDQKVRNSGNRTEGILFLGLGLDFRISRQWSVTAESANRGMLSDSMDLWVSGYPYDVYNVTSIGLKYRFGFNSGHNYYPKTVTKRKLHRAF